MISTLQKQFQSTLKAREILGELFAQCRRKSVGCTPLNHFPILSHAKIWHEKRHFFLLPDINCSQNINFLQENDIVHQIKGVGSRRNQLDFSL